MTTPAPCPEGVARTDGGRGEQLEMLRESALRFCAPDEHVPRSRRLRGTSPGFDSAVWRDMAGLGWLGMLVPEQYGGVGLGLTELAVVCEAAGRALLPEPLVAGVVLGAGAILHGDNDVLKRALLPKVVAGTLLPALAAREDGHDGDFLAVTTEAQRVHGAVRLSGVKRLVIGGAGADGFVVSARARDGIGLYWVAADRVANGLATVELADGRMAVDLTLDGVEVPDDCALARPGTAEAVLDRIRDEALIAMSAELLGGLSRTFEITLEYLRTRAQFGKLIGSYQALQHRAVDLHAAQFMSRCALNEVLDRVDRAKPGPAERGALASRVKVRCADSSLLAAREAIQMHGAMGFSDECDVGLYLKRAVVLSAWLGGPEVHRRRYARLAGTEPDIGA